MAILIGDHTTVDYDSDVLLFDVDEELHRLQTEEAPLTLLSSNSTRDSDRIADKPEYKWFESDLLDPVVTADASQTSGSTTLSLQSDDADQVHVQQLLYDTQSDEVMRVTAVNRSNDDLTVERAIGSSTATAISSDDTFIVFGPAEKEGADVPERVVQDRTKENNFVQIFRHSFGVTGTTAATILEAGSPEFDRQSRDKSLEHARAKEFAYMFGRKNEDTSSGVRRMTGGALEFISTNTKDMGADVTESKIDDFAQDVFKYGSSEKWVLSGGNFIKQVKQIASSQLEIMSGEDSTFGITVTRYITAFGPWNLVHSTLLDRHDKSDIAFVFDRQSIAEKVMDEERDGTLRMNVQNRGKDSVEAEYLSESGWKLMNEQKNGLLTNC